MWSVDRQPQPSWTMQGGAESKWSREIPNLLHILWHTAQDRCPDLIMQIRTSWSTKRVSNGLLLSHKYNIISCLFAKINMKFGAFLCYWTDGRTSIGFIKSTDVLWNTQNHEKGRWSGGWHKQGNTKKKKVKQAMIKTLIKRGSLIKLATDTVLERLHKVTVWVI